MPGSKKSCSKSGLAGPSHQEKCACPRELKKLCKQRRASGKASVGDIIAALSMEEEIKKLMETQKFQRMMMQPTLRVKRRPTRCRRHRGKPCALLMEPPMEKRMQFIRHCADEPFQFKRYLYEGYANEEERKRAQLESVIKNRNLMKNFRRVQYGDEQKTDIIFPYPQPPQKIDSEEEFKISSPQVSGENIGAQRAAIHTGQHPPLPGKSGHDLFAPHSGIILNPEKDFAPDYPAAMPRPGRPTRKREQKPCAKGGVCMNPKCKRKKCQYGQRRVKKALGARHGIKKAGSKRCWSLKYAASGARDGRARSRARKRFVADDAEVCGLDDVERPEHPDIPGYLKKGMFETHSLTKLPCKKIKRPDVHYGILLGSFNMYSDKFTGRSRGRQGLVMSVMAYCLAFHYHPKQWTAKLIDNLLQAGDVWYNQCADKQHDHSEYQGMCEVIQFGKKQVVLLNGKKMQVLLGEPDIVGYCMSEDPTIYNICRGLKAYFSDPCHRACVVLTRILKVAIWKDKICYYVFDPSGRDARAYQNFSIGGAALMNVSNLSSVAEILLTRSVLEDQKFVIAPIKVLKMIDERLDQDIQSEPELTQAEKAQMSYRILSENLAIVNANMHLGDKSFEDAKFRQSLPIAVAAMAYAKISPPNTWYTKTLDKIIRLGNKLYLECVQPKVVVDLTLDNIPNEITLGPYSCEIIIYRERVKGQLFSSKSCILNIRTGLEEFFGREYNSGIIDFYNYKLAVWRQKDMYYMFDPYPRTDEGRRSLKTGKACCFMLLNTDAMADVFLKNWDFLPPTTQFFIHAFKVLKLKKKKPKGNIKCLLSDDNLKKKAKRKGSRHSVECAMGRPSRASMVSGVSSSHGSGDGKPAVVALMAAGKPKIIDEEHMGEIISLVDSIQEEYVPPIPTKYKNAPPEEEEPRLANLDSPTVSVTQMIPPWPKPRDKTNEPPEPDPDPEPTPPPTPPPPIPPEGGVEEEEEEEELDEEQMKMKREEELRRRLEEEEARRRAEMLPPPMPPPPPTPQPEPEVPLAHMIFGGDYGDGGGAYGGGMGGIDDEVMMRDIDENCEAAAMMEPVPVTRYILLTEDAKKRYKMRQVSKLMTAPISEKIDKTQSEELAQLHNFKDLPDSAQIIRGNNCIGDKDTATQLPFASIMAVITSYKYMINTWTPGIVSFIVDSARNLYNKKKDDFQNAPLYLLPKITIGHQSYRATIDVIGEGPTWQLEHLMETKYLCVCDRGIITTVAYSCAFFVRNDLYYLFDGSCCNALGVRVTTADDGKACFLRFRSLHDLVCRILYNKDGHMEDQQFVISRIVVRRLLPEPRYQLPDDYDYDTMMPGDKKSKVTIAAEEKAHKPKKDKDAPRLPVDDTRGYQRRGHAQRIMGSTALTSQMEKSKGGAMPASHFVCLVAMLMACIHPLRTWNQLMVDICLEKGLEIYKKAENLSACEKRVIKNVLVEGKVMNINIKKILVINENDPKTLEQYVRAVLSRLRYVIIAMPNGTNYVITQSNGFFHVFDCFPPPDEEPEDVVLQPEYHDETQEKKKKDKKKEKEKFPPETAAGWTMYRSIEGVLRRLDPDGKVTGEPQFYTFELTSMRTPNRQSALAYKLSPLFRPEVNPNRPYLMPKRPRPIVDEKLYWLNNEAVPWSRVFGSNDLGIPRRTPKTLWKDWDIELPGDLFSLWGKLHPRDEMFAESRRGKQYLACCFVALALVQLCPLSGWTSSMLDGIVIAGDEYHGAIEQKIGNKPNHEVTIDDFNGVKGQYGPYSVTPTCKSVIFGFVYNMLPDRFNLARALSYFFEKYSTGILTSPMRNLAFGRVDYSYFMFDCQTFGDPIFCSNSGSAYILKCESLNRLIYVMTIALNTRGHNQRFHLYDVEIAVQEEKK